LLGEIVAFFETDIPGSVFVSKVEIDNKVQVSFVIGAVDCVKFEEKRKYSHKMFKNFTKEK